ncbi:protocadherin Fat 4-like [Leptodactylus fuscus]
MKMPGQLLNHLLLHFATLLFIAQGSGKPLSRSSLSSIPHLQGNQTTQDFKDVESKYDVMFNNAATGGTKPLTTYKLKFSNLNVKANPDHVPIFLQDNYRTSILETCQLNTTVLKVEAKDIHAYLIKYSLLGPHSDYFHMNLLTGVITLAKVLEYNRINSFNLNASAEDSRGFSSMVPVLIDIQDVDTMDPHFMFPLYEGSILENQKGSISIYPEAINAIDGDLGINETVYYSIFQVFPPEFRSHFSLDSSIGIISLSKEIDRESVSLLTVEIKATQQNNNLKSADAVVTVTLLDENDNAPQFSQSVYETFLPENSPLGLKALVLTASDKDKDGLSNARFCTNNSMFTVDKAGVMYFSQGELDRELAPRIYVQVWVFDAPSGGLNSSAEVIIDLIDVNDNNPEFHDLPLHFIIPEGDYTETKPVLVGTVNVTDLDEGLNGKVTIIAESENGDRSFRVQENGNIFVHGLLDREAKDKYVIYLIASDKGTPPRKSFANGTIFIEDINDNVPAFTQEEYSVDLILNKVKEGDTIMAVSAVDLDIGNNSLISYRFAHPHSGFAIKEDNGDIFLTSDVLANPRGTIVIPVIATDHGVPALSSTATVTISVSEGQTTFVNSNYSFSLPEGMPEGSDVGSVEISAGPNLSVKYFVKTYTTVFSITEMGAIITRVKLDREEQDSYNILVSAVDSQDPPNTTIALVTITVTDINDNMPVFSPLINSSITCLENKNFLSLANISATDLDIGKNGAIKYFLENEFNRTFHINSSTGEIMNLKPLDADKIDNYILKVIAIDSGIPPLSSTTSIHVTVQDVDDNSPIFQRDLYSITVKENEPPHVILNVSAADIDTGPNAAIVYSFNEISQLFYIGEESGSISNLKPLDFETSTEHVLTVIAYSPRNPHRQSNATVIVNIEDVNEEGPVVEYPVYNTVIWDGEYATGSIILDVNAKKANKNMDEGIHYSIAGDNREQLFSIANGTGHIFLTKDLAIHSRPKYYDITVICTDSGATPQSTSVKVFVGFSPTNITSPVFSSDYYIPESLNNWTVPNTYLIQIKAFYLHSSLIYSIAEEKNKDYFAVDPLSGVMRTKKGLKLEDFPSNVTVTATDSKRPWVHSDAIVHVTVNNGNQYSPVFTNSLVNATVKEEERVPTFIAQVQAIDKDPGRNGILTYSILNNHSNSFTIDATNGKVFAAKSFDFENGPHEFQVFICAEDDGIPHKKQGYLTLNVRVLDINDWAPVFLPHGSIYINESAPPGTVVGHITATDEDQENNAFLVYSLFDDDDQFDIDRMNGNIFIKRHLDHEIKEKSILTVTASNNKTAPFYKTRTPVTVYILDENDNAPQFTQENYFAELDVNSPVGSLVIALNATDRDEGNNGVLVYSLLPDLSSPYFLFEDERAGKIITATNRLKPGKISLQVVAKDRGSPSLNDTTSVIINLVNRNKTLPVFSPNELSTVLRKNKPKEEPAFTFSANAATGKNVIYRIVAGNDEGHFYLDKKTGELWTTENFYGKEQPSYNITVEAEATPDTQGPLPPNMAKLHIIVPDIKEGPVFEKETYDSTIVNTVPPGFPVIKVTAKMKGYMSSKPTLIYSLVNQSGDEFDIEKYTGQIVVAQVAGKSGNFHFKAQATDKNGYNAQTKVEIQVLRASPTSSSDHVRIKINKTLDEVMSHIPQIFRVLENVLQDNITIKNLDAEASDKHNTEIKLEVAGESYQDLVSKLKDNMPTIVKQLSSVFGSPIDINILQPQRFVMNVETIASIVACCLLVVVIIAPAVYFFIRKKKQDDTDRDKGCPLSETPSESKMHGLADDQNKSTKEADKDAPNEKTDQTVTDTQEYAEENAILKKDSAKEADKEALDQKTDQTVRDIKQYIEENTLLKKDGTKEADKEDPNKKTDETVTDTQEYADENAVLKKERIKGDEEAQGNKMDQTVTVTKEKTKEDDLLKQDSPKEADKEAPDQKMDQTGTDTQEQAEENTLVKKDSELENRTQKDVTVTEDEIHKEGQPGKVMEETKTEYVETWESYESSEDSDTFDIRIHIQKSDSIFSLLLKQETTESPEIAQEKKEPE